MGLEATVAQQKEEMAAQEAITRGLQLELQGASSEATKATLAAQASKKLVIAAEATIREMDGRVLTHGAEIANLQVQHASAGPYGPYGPYEP